MARKSATEVKIDFLLKEVQGLKTETTSLREDINKGKGAVWLLLILATVITSGYNYFIK